MIDSHCHLADAVFAADLHEVVARARAAGVARALCILSADEPDEVARAAQVKAACIDAGRLTASSVGQTTSSKFSAESPKLVIHT